MFDPFERVARAHHICPCCERSFSPEEEDEFVKKVGYHTSFPTSHTYFSIVFGLIFYYLHVQQRVKSASSAEHMKLLAADMSNADSNFQQLDKLRMVYEEYVKLKKETIPLTEKNVKELGEDLTQKSQAFDDVSFSV